MNNRTTLRKALAYVKRFIPLIALSLFLALITALITLYIPILVGNAVDAMIDKGNVDFHVCFT